MRHYQVPIDLGELTDALGAVRQQIRELQHQETGLRETLLAQSPEGPVNGRDYCMFIRNGTRRSLIKEELPDTILRDPRYWREIPVQTVVTDAHETQQTRQGYRRAS